MDYKPLVCVSWRDAADNAATWTDLEGVAEFGDEDCVVSSVGFMLYRGKHYIVLAGDNNETMWGRVVKIPLVNIIAVSELKPGAKRKVGG